MRSNEKSYQTYLFSYQHQGKQWCFDIVAESQEDALERLSKLPTATYDGIERFRIPAKLGWFAKLLCWFRNCFWP